VWRLMRNHARLSDRQPDLPADQRRWLPETSTSLLGFNAYAALGGGLQIIAPDVIRSVQRDSPRICHWGAGRHWLAGQRRSEL
jgi:hypothetical protein